VIELSAVPILTMGICVFFIFLMRVVRPHDTGQFFHDTFQNMLRMFIWSMNWWLKRPVRKRHKHVKRESLSFSPELIAFYKQKVRGRKELLKLWDERFFDICESTGTPLPPLMYQQQGEVVSGFNSHHRRGFIPHPPTCRGDFEMDEVRDGGGLLVTTYTHCSLCGWHATVTRDQAKKIQHAASMEGRYIGPVDGYIGDRTMREMQRVYRRGAMNAQWQANKEELRRQQQLRRNFDKMGGRD